MIKVGIFGCESLMAGELVRILINHPDVDLKWAIGSRPHARIDELHPGLIGECELTTTTTPDFNQVDIIFLCDQQASNHQFTQRFHAPNDMRIIDFGGCHHIGQAADEGWVYGLPEMYRRTLVHDTTHVTLPGSAAIATLLSTLPLATNLLLNSPLCVRLEMGSTTFPHLAEGKHLTADGADLQQLTQHEQREVAEAIALRQASFSQPVDLQITLAQQPRALKATTTLQCPIALDILQHLYEQYYDDHNFVFVVNHEVTFNEVINTNKCLLQLVKSPDDETLTITAVMDLLIKGMAGTAVHNMNLLFGLHERVGLALKSAGF